MASGFFALLDDIAVLAKVAAASIDDIAAGAAKAGAKSMGVIIDDAAVTPQYVSGLSPKRELPIIWRITKGSLVNKFLIVIPVAMLLSWLAPQFLPWLLVLGGSYLAFEGAEKVLEWFGVSFHHAPKSDDNFVEAGNTKKTEDKIVRSAVTTDLVLSAEIMLISMSNMDESNWIMRLAMLAVIAVMMTVAVYGAVSILIKIDDIGLHAAKNKDAPKWLRRLGFGAAKAMPSVFNVIGVVGTVAMLWVGGHILATSTHDLGFTVLYDSVHYVTYMVEGAGSVVVWFADTLCSAVIGVMWGLILVPVILGVGKVWRKVRPSKDEKHAA